MCGLLVKCAALILMIHGFRLLGRLAGPRLSGLALGLPSTTVIVLVLCGYERGSDAATLMAESSLLGLVAAVTLPLAYAQAMRHGWRLSGALGAAVAAYLAVACILGCLSAVGAVPRLGIALLAIVSASYWTKRLPIPKGCGAGATLSPFHALAARLAMPVIYVFVLGFVQHVAGPGCAGLVSTFPSMSLVVLAVTHLEAGAAEASRIAKVLPAGNTSTLAFLAAFRFASPAIGVAGATIAGYTAALASLLAIEWYVQVPDSARKGAGEVMRTWRSRNVPWRLAAGTKLSLVVFGSVAHAHASPRYLIRRRTRNVARFAPLVETLAS
jgi:hypothetical protein